MSLRLLGSLTAAGTVAAIIAACSSDNSTETTTDAGTGDAGTTSDAPITPSGPPTIAPATANVLTCGSLQLKETGGAGNGTWAVAPAVGTISTAGLYAAPTTAPTAPAVGVTYTEGMQSASAALQVATAFVGTPSLVPIGNTEGLNNTPFDHQLTANGAQIYAGLLNADFDHIDVFGSSDGGKTFALASSYHTGDAECGTVAVDAGNPQVVYLVYQAGHGDSTSNTGDTMRLAVSTDGAKTFPTEYVLADSVNGIANLTCPDVTSPSADHVVVTGAVFNGGVSGSPAHVGTWVSSTRGAGIGPVGTPLTCTQCPVDGSVFYATTDTNTPATQTAFHISVNGDGYSPRAATNGKGAVCMVFQYDGGNAPSPTEVQCSADNGGTWTMPTKLTAPTADAKIHPTIAVSPAGNVAVAWIDTVSAGIESFIAISTDGGKTFAAPVQVPALTVTPLFNVTDPVVAWESDDILWVSETADVGNAATIFVNKTCDMGKTWSGAVQVGEDQGTSLLMTTNGMIVAGDDTQTPAFSVTSLGGGQ